MSQYTQAYFDAETESIIVQRVDENGNVIPSVPQILIQLPDGYAPSDGLPKVLKIREWDVCITSGGSTVSKKALFISSEPY